MEQLEGLTFMGEPLDEATLLRLVRHERGQAVGLDNDDDVNRHRELALEYYRGIVSDMPVAVDDDGKPVDSNRSSSVSTDLADAVETILPDLIEVLFGDEDTITFTPDGPDDTERAEQETDYLRTVLFERNDGFMSFYEWIKEALLCRTTVAKWWWVSEPEHEEYQGKASQEQLGEMAQQGIEIVSAEPDEDDPLLLRYEARKMVRPPTVCWKPVPANDFGVADGTHRLKEARYCVMRADMQVQDLLADGYDEEKCRLLKGGHEDEDEGVDQARDVSNEDRDNDSESQGDLRVVEVVEHYLKADFEGKGRPQIWRIVTGNTEKVLLDVEKRGRIEFAALCPFPMPHRFHGLSLADKVMPWQRINTALLRAGLDNQAFQLNARLAVAMDDANEDTIDDLLSNEPGHHVRVKRQGAVSPIVTAPLTVNPFETMEQAKTMSELSSGVMRLNMGLNADALHDTKGGMQIQHNTGQKRTRMMARLFAEGGIRDLMLGVHDCLRSNATMTDTARLRGQFVEVDPRAWARRMDMTINIGVGSGGREMALMAKGMLKDVQAMIVEGQMSGAIGAQIVTPANVYALAKSIGDRLGEKAVEMYFTNPEQEMAQPKEEKPDPEQQKLQAEMQMKQADMQMRQQEAEASLQMKQAEMQAKHEITMAQMRMEDERKRLQMQAEYDLRREQMAAELELSREKMAAELELKREMGIAGAASDANAGPPVRPGGAVG